MWLDHLNEILDVGLLPYLFPAFFWSYGSVVGPIQLKKNGLIPKLVNSTQLVYFSESYHSLFIDAMLFGVN